jgi:hypothetical protein
MRAEIDEGENRKMTEKIDERKSWFSEQVKLTNLKQTLGKKRGLK